MGSETTFKSRPGLAAFHKSFVEEKLIVPQHWVTFSKLKALSSQTYFLQ